MSKSNFTENAVLDCIVRGVDVPFRANANRWIALYTADPGEAGTAITNEVSFTGYARVAVVASSGFSAASGGSTSNTGLISFNECTAGTGTVTHTAIVTTASGAGEIIASGALTASRNFSPGIALQFAASTLTYTED
jgi:hypothetical protein